MDFSKDDVLKIIKIIEVSGYNEVRLEAGDFKLHVQKHGAAAASAPSGTSQPAEARSSVAAAEAAPAAVPPRANRAAAPQQSKEPEIPEGLVAVRAPMLGTFYRSPAPGEKPFVEVGDKVEPDDILCLVEVMKLFNSVKAGVAGTVVKILAENATMVEYGQPLILIEHELIGAPDDE